METINAWSKYNSETCEAIEKLSAEYRSFLDQGKTERECVTYCVEVAKAHDWKDMAECIRNAKKLKAGDRVYLNWMNKVFMMFIVGTEPMEKGMNILGAHIDSPRIDVKSNPLYEDSELAYLDTHYYGGIKKYQWVAQPLAIHGVIVRKDGVTVNVAVGEDENDPVFCISDLLPHLASEQMEKSGAKVVAGEDLDLIIGGKPMAEQEKNAVKEGVLAILHEKFAVEEEDLLSAELEIVPAGKARDMGFDRSMILAYGHDDRVCAYPSMRALLDYEGTPARTLACILTDKEEIGSVGATGMGSMYFENTVAELLALKEDFSELALRRALRNSNMLSSDVSAGYDPHFASVFEKKNVAFLGHGICFNKYTGARGKSSSNDANAEYIGCLRNVMDRADVAYQFCELGRVDAGGGGTIAYICAKYCMNVIDAGVAVLSMHAPYEVINKADLYEAYRCYCAFLNIAD